MHTSALMSAAAGKKSLLFVDDEIKVLDAFRRMLRPFAETWNVHFVSDSRTAADVAKDYHVDIIVTDLCMPFVSGIDLIRKLQECDDTRYIPVIVVTGQSDCGLKRQALDIGAADLLNRPVELEDLLARVRSSLRLKACYDELHCRNSELEFRVRERTQQLRQSRLEIIERLGKAAEYRDCATGRHVVRVAHFSRLIAQELKLPQDEIDTIFAAAPLHDVGKIAIPDSILLKRGVLAEDERRIMNTHCAVGEQILSVNVDRLIDLQAVHQTEGDCSDNSFCDPLLDTARQIAATHHEHWNGQGYPKGLTGEEIPLAGRIVAVADVFDALTTSRPYKPEFSTVKAVEIMSGLSGQQFDPRVFAAFLAVLPEIEATRLKLKDCPTTLAAPHGAAATSNVESHQGDPKLQLVKGQRATIPV